MKAELGNNLTLTSESNAEAEAMVVFFEKMNTKGMEFIALSQLFRHNEYRATVIIVPKEKKSRRKKNGSK